MVTRCYKRTLAILWHSLDDPTFKLNIAQNKIVDVIAYDLV